MKIKTKEYEKGEQRGQKAASEGKVIDAKTVKEDIEGFRNEVIKGYKAREFLKSDINKSTQCQLNIKTSLSNTDDFNKCKNAHDNYYKSRNIALLKVAIPFLFGIVLIRFDYLYTLSIFEAQYPINTAKLLAFVIAFILVAIGFFIDIIIKKTTIKPIEKYFLILLILLLIGTLLIVAKNRIDYLMFKQIPFSEMISEVGLFLLLQFTTFFLSLFVFYNFFGIEVLLKDEDVTKYEAHLENVKNLNSAEKRIIKINKPKLRTLLCKLYKKVEDYKEGYESKCGDWKYNPGQNEVRMTIDVDEEVKNYIEKLSPIQSGEEHSEKNKNANNIKK